VSESEIDRENRVSLCFESLASSIKPESGTSATLYRIKREVVESKRLATIHNNQPTEKKKRTEMDRLDRQRGGFSKTQERKENIIQHRETTRITYRKV
jgi:hypothetical protein